MKMNYAVIKIRNEQIVIQALTFGYLEAYKRIQRDGGRLFHCIRKTPGAGSSFPLSDMVEYLGNEIEF